MRKRRSSSGASSRSSAEARPARCERARRPLEASATQRPAIPSSPARKASSISGRSGPARPRRVQEPSASPSGRRSSIDVDAVSGPQVHGLPGALRSDADHARVDENGGLAASTSTAKIVPRTEAMACGVWIWKRPAAARRQLMSRPRPFSRAPSGLRRRCCREAVGAAGLGGDRQSVGDMSGCRGADRRRSPWCSPASGLGPPKVGTSAAASRREEAGEGAGHWLIGMFPRERLRSAGPRSRARGCGSG